MGDRRNHGVEVAPRMGHPDHNPHAQGDNRHQEVDELCREEEEGNDNHHDGHSNRRAEEANDDDNRHDEGYNHGAEVGRDRSSHQKVGSRHDEMVEVNESDSDHCVESHLESNMNEHAILKVMLGELTSASQRTLAPLNSRLSSFSTAALRSLAVSNSTKLGSSLDT